MRITRPIVYSSAGGHRGRAALDGSSSLATVGSSHDRENADMIFDTRRRELLRQAGGLSLLACSGAMARDAAARGRIIDVADYRQLAAAVAVAQPGDEILLADGIYDGDCISVPVRATATQPLRIQAANLLAARVPNGFCLTGAHITLQGIDFATAGVAAEQVQLGGEHNQLWRSRFRSSGGINLALHDGRSGRVMYCEFMANDADDDWQESNRNLGSHFNDVTDHRAAEIGYCYFHDLPKKPANQPYSTRSRAAIGLSNNHVRSMRPTNWHIHHCLFSRCGGSRVHIKTSNNLIEYCTITDSDGGSGFYATDFNQRFGTGNIYRGCWAENCAGYRVMGGWHSYISCRSSNAGATDVFMGSQEANVVAPSYPRADNCKFTACEFPLVIGRKWSGMTLLARRTRIENHFGTIDVLDGNHVDTLQTSEMSEVPVTPLKLTPAMVGPFADL